MLAGVSGHRLLLCEAALGTGDRRLGDHLVSVVLSNADNGVVVDFLIDRLHGLPDAIDGAVILACAQIAYRRLSRSSRAVPAASGVIEVPFIESRTKVFAPKLAA